MTNPHIEEADQLAQQYGYTTPIADQPAEFLNSVYAAMPNSDFLAFSVFKPFQDANGNWNEFTEQFWFTKMEGFDGALNQVLERNRQLVPYQPGLLEPNSAFWGCASRKPDIALQKNKRGKVHELLHVTTLWCDIDCEIHGYSLAQGLEPILALPLEPTWVVFSGGGLQCEWVLSEAVDVSTERLAKKYKALMLDFTQPIFTRLKLEADLHVAETVRMMRLPGTINRKYKRDGAIARVIFHDPANIYSLAQVQEYARRNESHTLPVPLLERPQSAPTARKVAELSYGCLDKGAESLVKKWFDKLEAAAEGTRHNTLVSALGAVLPLVTANRADYATIESLFKSTARQIGLDYDEVEDEFSWAWDKAKATPLYSRPRGWTDGRIDLEATPIDLKPGDATPPIRYGMSVPLLEQQFVIDTAFEGARGMATLQHRILEGRVRYDHSEKEFYYWNGHAYTKDRTRLMSDAVLYTQAQYRHHAATLEGEAQQAEAAAKEKLDAAITADRRKSPRKNARLSKQPSA